MKEKVEYNIHKFSNSVDSDIIEQIYVLNQENTPEVGSLSSIKDLQNLIRLSSITVSYTHLTLPTKRIV